MNLDSYATLSRLGPIVRTGATPEFWRNWDNIFGGKKKSDSKAAPAKSSAKKKPATAKKPAAKARSKKK